MLKFQDLEQFTSEEITAAIKRNDPDELQLVSITVAILCPDQILAQDVCIKLSFYENGKVRGNAVMSLGHLARRFRALDEVAVRPVIERALQEQDEYVRSLAKSAADELHQFLGWDIAGHVYG